MKKNYLIIGCGQIGKSVLSKVLNRDDVGKIIIHNLTSEENKTIQKVCKDENIIYSYGNIFFPTKYCQKEDFNNEELEQLIKYFYEESDENVIKQSKLYELVEKYNPEVIVDTINTATIFGNNFKPENTFKLYLEDSKRCCKELMMGEFVTKFEKFISTLKYCIENMGVKKYIKVSTTGLGGMGLNMPYTHGDNPKSTLSNALIGKISASGTFHQLLWNLSHIPNFDIALIIPATFVGYDFFENGFVETNIGNVLEQSKYNDYDLNKTKKLLFSEKTDEKYIKFPVVRAGENHVYSINELKVLTSIGQMEAITKEEVSNAVLKEIDGKSTSNILLALDKYALAPTYAGRKMIEEILEKNKHTPQTYGVATGNLGVSCAKHLYELWFVKRIYPTLEDIFNKQISDENINVAINKILLSDKEIIKEIISLGMPVLYGDNQIILGSYSLVPETINNEELTLSEIENFSKIGWVDLRANSIKSWKKDICETMKYLQDKKYYFDNFDIYYNKLVLNDYDIAEILGLIYNNKNKHRIK